MNRAVVVAAAAMGGRRLPSDALRRWYALSARSQHASVWGALQRGSTTRSLAHSRHGGSAAAPDVEAASSSIGWCYEDVNPATGKTHLDTLYETHLSRIQAILEEPLPPLPRDGNVEPDLFVGFAHYNYRLRDEYRALLARELGLPVRALRLSVAWSGRFDVSRFNRVQKVCGVVIDRIVLRGYETVSGDDSDVDDEALPAELQRRVDAVISAINSRGNESMLGAQIVQASGPIPEVQFTLSKREQRLLAHMHRWIHANVLRPQLVVLVCGGNASQQQQQQGGETSVSESGTQEEGAERRHSGWLERDLEEESRQRRFVQGKWVKSFHSREVVPQVLSLGAFATLLARPAVRGELLVVAAATTAPASATSSSEGTSDDADGLLDSALRDFLSTMNKGGEAASIDSGDVSQERTLTNVFADPAAMATLSSEHQVQAERWLQLVRGALLYSARGSDGTAEGVGARLLPAMFVHGSYAGGIQEMRYLQHNKRAMDALLLHPNDVGFKKSFASRSRNGHTRLRLHEEAAAGAHGGGS